ncbi:hypothetical protein [Cupriavidus plantarum]|uniref:hypothetical protein n=1 Tax=Cupriavidus plantarum TaxID=942865 RepID=UPI0011B21FAA|nr:hypothetical protein [Cupriavidus plantarum]NYI02099.1 hypothetical protein [Cupriavidus plantarum]
MTQFKRAYQRMVCLIRPNLAIFSSLDWSMVDEDSFHFGALPVTALRHHVGRPRQESTTGTNGIQRSYGTDGPLSYAVSAPSKRWSTYTTLRTAALRMDTIVAARGTNQGVVLSLLAKERKQSHIRICQKNGGLRMKY